MNLLPAILSRVACLQAVYSPDGEYGLSVFVRQRGLLATSDWEHAKGLPVVVIVCGHGVVTKPEGSEIAARIIADGDTFLYSTSGGETSFVRRAQLHRLAEELTSRKIVPVALCCAASEADFEAAANEYAVRFLQALRWKSLLRMTDEASAVAQAFVRRLALPVLGGFLLLLSGNMLVSKGLNSRRQALRAELSGREQAASATASADAQLQRLLGEFGAQPAVTRSVVADRIARAVPERLRLTTLEIEPLAKRFEAGKPLQRREGVVVIRGLAPAAADVSLFVERLSETGCCRDVRLVSVEKQRDALWLAFSIETKL